MLPSVVASAKNSILCKCETAKKSADADRSAELAAYGGAVGVYSRSYLMNRHGVPLL